MITDDELRSRLSELPSPTMPTAVHEAVAARLRALAIDARAPAEVVPLTPKHRSRLNGLLLAAAVAAFAMLMSVAVQSPQQPPVAGVQNPVIKAGAIYNPAGFIDELRVRYLDTASTSAPTNTFADSAQGIVECTSALAAYGQVLSIDTGRYGNAAAAVVITRYPLNTEYEEIWVVTPACGATDTAVMDHMVVDVDDSAANL